MKEFLVYVFGIKRFISILLTITFCILAVKGKVTGDQFVTIFAVIISFYFGQSTARQAINENKSMIDIEGVNKLSGNDKVKNDEKQDEIDG
ncbi:hypothetical protein [Clostridium ihumii]|uniref:hypothetical protein n=1 Tax=Clostridium ihumii TaxID=1470356 RepID=UPI0005512A7D|nr:hypothetical protein [Clostridium ihumii]